MNWDENEYFYNDFQRIFPVESNGAFSLVTIPPPEGLQREDVNSHFPASSKNKNS